jgi:hypothetical protein
MIGQQTVNGVHGVTKLETRNTCGFLMEMAESVKFVENPIIRRYAIQALTLTLGVIQTAR